MALIKWFMWENYFSNTKSRLWHVIGPRRPVPTRQISSLFTTGKQAKSPGQKYQHMLELVMILDIGTCCNNSRYSWPASRAGKLRRVKNRIEYQRYRLKPWAAPPWSFTFTVAPTSQPACRIARCSWPVLPLWNIEAPGVRHAFILNSLAPATQQQ